MVSNLDRISKEISKEAERAPGGFDPVLLTTLALTIVDEEDKHQIKHANINQIVEDLINQAANLHGGKE